MRIRDWIHWKKRGLRHRLGLKLDNREHYIASPQEVAAFQAKAQNELARMFYEHKGRPITKWAHYFEFYDQHFSRFRGTPCKMLEIGVFQGGSLDLWREYLGSSAILYGIDIDPNCAGKVTPPSQVRIGSQDDPNFLRGVVAEMGAPDIVLDDGSHVGKHQEASFRTLFPLLKSGGIYVIEDLHTAYWPGDWEGGYRRKGTAIELVKRLIDDMHAWHHAKGEDLASAADIRSIHITDSVVFVEKAQVSPPKGVDLLT